MTAAVTPKGERRRYALVSAAAELLCEGGFDAVRHRAVARRAGMPLASTTYYFTSLDDLIAKAVEHVGEQEAAQLRTRLAGLSRRRRGAESTAEVLVDLLLGDPSTAHIIERLIARYELYVVCARQPALREIQRRIRQQRADAVIEAVERSGRSVGRGRVTALVCAVDGAVVAALVGDRESARASARATLVDVIDALAPFDATHATQAGRLTHADHAGDPLVQTETWATHREVTLAPSSASTRPSLYTSPHQQPTPGP
jgi:DNA-binding transcriptional regulator YbjK